MYYEVDVEWLPSRPVDSILQAVVKASPPVHRSVANYPRALEEPKRVAVNRKHVPPKAVQENATRGLPRQARQASQEALRSVIVHVLQDIPGVTPGFFLRRL